MELLGDVGHVESHFIPFGDSVSVGAWFALDIPLAQKSFWTHLMVPQGDDSSGSSFGVFGDSANVDAR